MKYTLVKYNANDPKGCYGEKQIIKEQDTLDGFLEEIFKDIASVYVIIYPCTEGHPNFDSFTGKWSFQIGTFNRDLDRNDKNDRIVSALERMFESTSDIQNLLKS